MGKIAFKKWSSPIDSGPKKHFDACLFCGAPLYRLNDGRVKCSACKRRYSPAKLARSFCLADAFCRDLSAAQAARECGVTPLSAQKHFRRFRALLLPWLEAQYEAHREAVREYDETLYLDHNKRRDRRRIFEAHNFLTFDYGGRVYTILMPSLERYKESFLDDGLEEVYHRELSTFLKMHRIARLERHDNTIVRFWHFLDRQFKRYKGIPPEQFIYYLKEAEFKFNCPGERCRETLRDLILSRN